MKILKLTGAICFVLCTLLMVSCSDDDSQPNNNGNPQTGELALFALDTAKVNVMTHLGDNETTIINKMQNSSSYIGDMSVSTDGTQFAYSNYQRTFNPQSFTTELRVANTDGSNDHVVYTSSEPYVSISAIRFCSDNKIFFIAETTNPTVRKMYTVNPDGASQQQIQGQYNMDDISNDRQYYLIPFQSSTTNMISIIDKNGDGGAGGLYHNETFTAGQSFEAGSFTNDGTKVVIPFHEGTDVKVKIIDMATKTATTKTMVTGLGSGWLSFQLEMAGDSNRGVLTLTGSDYPKSKSYVFNLATGEVAQPFENNDENIFSVYAY